MTESPFAFVGEGVTTSRGRFPLLPCDGRLKFAANGDQLGLLPSEEAAPTPSPRRLTCLPEGVCSTEAVWLFEVD